MSALRWGSIDLGRDADIAVAIRVDSYVASFGNADLFRGREHYLSFLQRRLEWDPASVAHLWRTEADGSERIVGQVELGKDKDDEGVGYVNLFYLVADCRGTGLGTMLEDYATRFFGKHGIERARLSVVPANVRAVRFYVKHGWRDIGARPDAPLVRLMEKTFTSA
jgi:ribosomal protein S18 acetylase RimI-like enzyme